MPNDAGEVDVTIVAPFAHRPGCTVTAVQLTILGALRASSPCTGGGLARPE